jgi:AcrR family transcriptional regulator
MSRSSGRYDPAGMETRSRNVERSEATRVKLIRAGRQLFARRGYGAVGTEQIVRRARVTRGALYHHFRDKRDLFRAVHEQLETELAQKIGAQMAEVRDDPIEVLQQGVRTFLDACTDPALARIALVDAPSVLGWEEWRATEERYGLGLVTFGLQAAMDAGALRVQPVKPLAHLLLGAMEEAGIVIANASDPQAARREIEPALLGLLDGLRAG